MRLVSFTFTLGLLAVTTPGRVTADLIPAPVVTEASRDAATLQDLRKRIGGSALIRVDGTFGSAELSRPSLEADGLHFVDGRMLRERDAGGLPRSIPMEQVTTITVPKRQTRNGMLVGMTAGALVLMVREMRGRTNTNSSAYLGGIEGVSAVGRVVAHVAVGAAAGAMVGSMVQRWEPIYATP